MSERDLTHKYMTISTKYVNNTINDMTLSDELGSTIATIVEVSMTHGKHDLMGEKSKNNVDKFLREEYKKTHIVEYDGYDGSDIRTSISRIYELSKYKKSDIYPLMVMRTADLWASIHNSKTKNISKVTKTFIRRPSNIAFTGNYNTTSAADQLNTKSVTDTNEALSNNKSSYNDAGSGQDKSNEPGPAIILLIPIRQ